MKWNWKLVNGNIIHVPAGYTVEFMQNIPPMSQSELAKSGVTLTSGIWNVLRMEYDEINIKKIN